MNAQAEAAAAKDVLEMGLAPEELDDPDYVPPYTIADIMKVRAALDAGRIQGAPWREAFEGDADVVQG